MILKRKNKTGRIKIKIISKIAINLLCFLEAFIYRIKVNLPMERLELSWVAPHGPKPCVSTNCTTSA